MARKKQAVEATTTVRLVPSVTSFDFLEGTFAASQRTRQLGLAITGAALAVLLVLAMMGVGGMVDKRSANSDLESVQAQNSAAVAKLAQIDNAGGLSADQLTGHVNERHAALKSAVGSEIDVVSFITKLQATAPAGVTVTAITFHDAASGVTNAAPASSSSASESTTPTTTGSSSDPSALGTIEIQGTVTDFALIGEWAKAVSKVPGLSTVNPTWTGGGTAITTTLTATITQDGLTARAQRLASGKVY